MRTRRVVVAAVLAAVVAFAVTWAVEPNLIVGLRSPRALGWAAGLGVVCAALACAAYRVSRRGWVALAVAAVPAVIATGGFVVRPILSPRSLDEAFPPVGAGASADAADPTTVASPAAASSAPAAATETSTEPVLVAAGPLRGLAGHDAEGRVATYRLADGSHLVRFENVDIGGTPSPHVYVLPGADRRDKGGVHLGELKAEKGSFHYPLPRTVAPKDFTVLVWCEQFAVEIANATRA